MPSSLLRTATTLASTCAAVQAGQDLFSHSRNDREGAPSRHIDELDANSSWIDVVSAQLKDQFNLAALDEAKEGFSRLYGLLTKDPEQMMQRRKHQRERGVLRSGEGTPEQVANRLRKFDERERIENMFATGEKAQDIPTHLALHEYYIEQLNEKPGVKRNDK